MSDTINFRPGEGRSWARTRGEQTVYYNEEAGLNPASVKELKKVSTNLTLEIKNVSGNPFPKYKKESDISFPLQAYIEKNIQIFPGDTKLINTGLYMKIPDGYVGKISIYPEFLLLDKQFIWATSIADINSEYNNEILVILTNLSQNIKEIKSGDIIAYFSLHPVVYNSKVDIVEKKDKESSTVGSDDQF
ncbi:MAG: hypothetical protein LBH55_01125 [Mycoplasmataceae bacterium]|jgi:dUTPase|nr:hypothetical protein [Mycoplasmataceae bacterium]